MFRYVTLNDNKTVDKESENPFDGAVKVFIADDKLSTFMYTPYLCWVEKVNDTYVIHIPDDAPRPPYEQKIQEFKDEIAKLKETSNSLSTQLKNNTEQLNESNENNLALVKQLKSVQAQNMQFAQQISMLDAQNKAKEAQINDAQSQAQPATQQATGNDAQNQ